MRRFQKLVLTLLLAAGVLLTLADAIDAQGLKIGFVRDERIFQEYKAWTKAQEQWEVDKKAWDEEAIAQQENLIELQEEYEKQKLILSDDKRKEREAAINVKRDALDLYTKTIFGPDGRAERKYNELLEPVLQGIHNAIETVAIEGNYDVILTLQAVGYIKESYDITDKVLKYLDEYEG